MFKHIAGSRAIWQGLALACVIAGSAMATSAAFAGECPADKIKANAREKVDYKPVGVTDVTLGSIDLEKEPAHIKGRELRFRKLTIEPGGIVPWHSHDDRPALIFVQQGEIVEYASNCSIRSCTRPAISGPKCSAPRTGGRISARRRSFSMSATSARIRTTTTCNERRSASRRLVTGCDVLGPTCRPTRQASHPSSFPAFLQGAPAMTDMSAADEAGRSWRCTVSRRAWCCARSSSA